MIYTSKPFMPFITYPPILFIRIRENGCPRYDSSSIKINLKDNSNLELKNAIEHIFDILKKYLDVEKFIDIDID